MKELLILCFGYCVEFFIFKLGALGEIKVYSLVFEIFKYKNKCWVETLKINEK